MSFDARQAHQNFRLPPDGTGKRMEATHFVQLKYTGATSIPVRGDYITGQTSNATMEVISVLENTATEGTLILVPESYDAQTFTQGENLLVAAVPFAIAGITADYQTDWYTQKMNLASGDNTSWTQRVDKEGSAYVRFTEGAQQLDAYGISRIVSPSVIANYNFTYDQEPEDFTSMSGSGGSVTYESGTTAVTVAVDNSSGSLAMFHSKAPYLTFPGSSISYVMALSLSDTGKANCVRRWGFFDSNDGFFFQLSGTALSVVQRSSIGGTVTDNVISQSLWDDPLAANASEDGMVLDVSKLNVYWFNLQTLTGGRTRFGVFNEQGARVTVFNDVDLNVAPTPTYRSMMLPMRIEIFNEGTTSGASELRLFGFSVKSEGTQTGDEQSQSRFSSMVQPTTASITSTSPKPIASFRSGLTFKGQANRIITVPHEFSTFVSGSPVVMRVVKNGTLTSASFGPAGSNTPVEGDMAATAISGGRDIYSQMLDTGITQDHFSEHIWGSRAECMTLDGDGSYGDVFTITCEKVESTLPDASVKFSFVWADIG